MKAPLDQEEPRGAMITVMVSTLLNQLQVPTEMMIRIKSRQFPKAVQPPMMGEEKRAITCGNFSGNG